MQGQFNLGIGLDGVQIDLKLVGDNLDVAQAEKRQDYKRQMRETGLPICYDDVVAARAAIGSNVIRTPCLRSQTLSE